MNEKPSLRKAEFNPKVCTYWTLSGAIILCLTFFGIPLLILWLPVGLLLTERYLKSMECLLTNKELKVNKGIFVRVEKTIPLEKITDVGMIQGPIMRHFGLHKLTFETAGQSGDGALVSLTGIVDAKAFREAVLNQREAHATNTPIQKPKTASKSTSETSAVLMEIRDTLLRIETKIERSK